MIKLNHPNLLPLLACCVLSDTDIRLVTPFMANGSLASNLTTLPPKRILPVAQQIAWGLEYLHGRNMVHRDLSTLIDSTLVVAN